jgi:hypothetical protein
MRANPWFLYSYFTVDCYPSSMSSSYVQQLLVTKETRVYKPHKSEVLICFCAFF